MAEFLNTKGLSEWIPKIINDTKRELVILAPYLQLSDKIYQCLKDVNARGVETTLIYRENKLNEKEKLKLLSLDNLNLMYHPNLHAKCLLNENYLLISSINLYEYSEKNNREMGILHFGSVDNTMRGDDAEIFKDAVKEILIIQNGATIQKESKETITDGFEMDILKTEEEKNLERLKNYNKIFVHKRFEINNHQPGEGFGNYICKSYMDKVDIKIGYRIEFTIGLQHPKLWNYYHQNIQPNKSDLEFKFEGFKTYWNCYDTIFVYEDSRHALWRNVKTDTDQIMLYKKVIEEVVSSLKSSMN